MGNISGPRYQPSLVMPVTDYSKNQRARQIFDGIAPRYNLISQLLSFYQAGAWRQFLVSRLKVGPGDTVLDICTGTAVLALKIAGKSGARVVGVDLSDEMLRQGQQDVSRAGLESSVALVKGRAEDLGFSDASFDSVCFTWLLRYVDSPPATLSEVVRVLKPGGSLVSLEFGVPDNIFVRGLWNVYTRLGLPLTTRFMSPGWRHVGSFLGPNIAEFCRNYSVEDLRRIWTDLGIVDVRVKKLSLGGGVVMWGTKAPVDS